MPQPDQRFRVNTGEVTAKILDGEAIIINLTDGLYYSLDGPGALVWAMAGAGSSAAEIADELTGRYGAPADGVRADVDRVLEHLLAEGLLVPGAEEGADGQGFEDVPDRDEYVSPRLETYSDMSEMLRLDPPLPGIRDVPWQASEGS